MKFRASIIGVVLLVCAVQLYGQQLDSTSHNMLYQCLGPHSSPPGVMTRPCKPDLGGAQTQQPWSRADSPDEAGTIITFDVPGAVNGTVASSINAAGAITGSYFDVNFISHGFLRAPEGAFTTFDVPGDVFVGLTDERRRK